MQRVVVLVLVPAIASARHRRRHAHATPVGPLQASDDDDPRHVRFSRRSRASQAALCESGLVWRLARPADPRILRQSLQADVGPSVVIVSERSAAAQRGQLRPHSGRRGPARSRPDLFEFASSDRRHACDECTEESRTSSNLRRSLPPCHSPLGPQFRSSPPKASDVGRDPLGIPCTRSRTQPGDDSAPGTVFTTTSDGGVAIWIVLERREEDELRPRRFRPHRGNDHRPLLA